jgi:alkylation response protein AidB-like acyl-CoA dehydrogenase
MRWTIEDTPERAAFRQQFLDWLREALPAGWAEAIETGDEEKLAKAREGWDFLGWSRVIGMSGYGAPLWPKEYGGLSGEPWMQQIVREELARYRLPTVGINILGVGLAGPTLIAHGTEEQKKRYLQKILTSEEIWCQLFSEPGSGSDLASCGTRAVRSNGEWIVNGQKVWTSIAQVSHFGMLLARTDPDVPKHDGLSYFIVDMRSPGVDIRPLRQITGSAEFNEVYFTDVRIPAENIVGTEGDGWRVARTTLMNERVALSGLSLDAASFMGGTRKDPWGLFLDSVPDHSDPLSRQFIAQAYIEKEVKEITQFRANAARMRGEQPGPEGGVTKVYNAEYNQWRSNQLMNLNGPAAVAWERGDTVAENRAHAFLRARANSIEGGTSEILRNQMGERILGLPREPEVDRGIPWKDIKRN